VEGCVVDSMDFGTISPPLELFICRWANKSFV
jgi:hypothetical protein